MGHPESPLFIAGQVGAAAGLKDPRKTVENFFKRRQGGQGIRLVDLTPGDFEGTWITKSVKTRNWRVIWMMPAPLAYEMLHRCYESKSEPFRNWVNETLKEIA